MFKNNVEVSVSVNGGKSVKEYNHNGLTFIESKLGSSFTLKIKNNSWRRALATISVDGRCAISGNKAKNSDEGYIIDGYSSIEVKGFRISDDKVATFVFGQGHKSYASYKAIKGGEIKGGESSPNNGVIGVKITWEKQQPTYTYYPPIWWEPVWKSTDTYSQVNALNNQSTNWVSVQNSQPTSSMLRSYSFTPNFDMGVEFGEAKQDSVKRVDFERSGETFTIEIYYASRKALISMGVDIEQKKSIAKSLPSAFGDYCEIPSGWY